MDEVSAGRARDTGWNRPALLDDLTGTLEGLDEVLLRLRDYGPGLAGRYLWAVEDFRSEVAVFLRSLRDWTDEEGRA